MRSVYKFAIHSLPSGDVQVYLDGIFTNATSQKIFEALAADTTKQPSAEPPDRGETIGQNVVLTNSHVPDLSARSSRQKRVRREVPRHVWLARLSSRLLLLRHRRAGACPPSS
jgi:hypothetical protein